MISKRIVGVIVSIFSTIYSLDNNNFEYAYNNFCKNIEQVPGFELPSILELSELCKTRLKKNKLRQKIKKIFISLNRT